MFAYLSRIFRGLPPSLDLQWPARARRRVLNALEERHRRVVAWRDLRSIDEATLRDIGLSHRAAADRPFIPDEP
jgi:hypothetical protein